MRISIIRVLVHGANLPRRPAELMWRFNTLRRPIAAPCLTSHRVLIACISDDSSIHRHTYSNRSTNNSAQNRSRGHSASSSNVRSASTTDSTTTLSLVEGCAVTTVFNFFLSASPTSGPHIRTLVITMQPTARVLSLLFLATLRLVLA